MDETLIQIWANELIRKLILSLIVWLVSILARHLLHRLIVDRLPDDSPNVYVVGKAVNYAVTILAALLIVAIWVENLGDLSLTLGLLAAGLAFALQEVIGSIAGWTTILSGRPFIVGDPIEISQRILTDFAVAGIVIASQTLAIVQFPSTMPQ